MNVRFDTPATRLLDIDVPIIQGAMAWLSEAEMVAAVCNEGGMGFLGASVMSADASALITEAPKKPIPPSLQTAATISASLNQAIAP